MLVPLFQPVAGSATCSNFFPSRLRSNSSPGAASVVKAKSIQPSLLKSRVVLEVPPETPSGHEDDEFHFPSRGLRNRTGEPPSRVAIRSTARSLLTSLAMRDVAAPSKVIAVSLVESVKVLLPLLRQI